MPTNVELAKKIEELEEKLNAQTEKLEDRVFGRILLKFETSRVDVVKMKVAIDELVASAEYTEKLVGDLWKENASLIAENKSLKSENRTMSRKIAELEQYSRLNSRD